MNIKFWFEHKNGIVCNLKTNKIKQQKTKPYNRHSFKKTRHLILQDVIISITDILRILLLLLITIIIITIIIIIIITEIIISMAYSSLTVWPL